MPSEQTPISPLSPSGPYVTPQPPITPAPKRSVWQVVVRALKWFWIHLGYKMRVFVLLMSAIIVVALGEMALGIKPYRSHPSSTATSTSTVPSTSGTSFTSPSQLSVACGTTGRAIKGNDKYKTGKAPYHIAVFEQSEFYQTPHYDYSFPTDVITDPTVGPAVRPVAPGATQLVACVDRTAEASTGRSCPYQPIALPIYSAEYEVTVYEAATHRVVLHVPVMSVPLYTTRDNCPIEHEYDPKNPRIYYPVSGVDLASALKQIVQ